MLFSKSCIIYYIYFYLVDNTTIKHDFLLEGILICSGIYIFYFAYVKRSKKDANLIVNNDLLIKANSLCKITNMINRITAEE